MLYAQKRWLVFVLFAVAMAWLEAATVIYARTLVGRLEPYQPDPLPFDQRLAPVEIIREAATMVMLATAGYLAGKTVRSRFAFFLIAFGVWDIFYYVFLAAIGPWPRSIADWDILFLIPLPWWGPVWAPASIAALMVIGGTLVVFHDSDERPFWPRRSTWLFNGTGATLALYVFMADAIRMLPHGPRVVAQTLPVTFLWPLFLIGLALMAVPVMDLVRRVSSVECRVKGTDAAPSPECLNPQVSPNL
jgi:hypothetical protein